MLEGERRKRDTPLNANNLTLMNVFFLSNSGLPQQQPSYIPAHMVGRGGQRSAISQSGRGGHWDPPSKMKALGQPSTHGIKNKSTEVWEEKRGDVNRGMKREREDNREKRRVWNCRGGVMANSQYLFHQGNTNLK